MRIKKLISILVLITVLNAVQVVANYSDISNHWAKDQITRWYNYGVITDSGNSFHPDNFITRGEMAILIDNLMGYKIKSTEKFSDLGQSIYTDPILRASKAGIISGSNGKIRPRDKITREEAAVMMCKAFQIAPGSSSINFSDSQSISSWAKQYVSALVNKGYISGKNNNKFEPKGNITKAEAITIIDNIVSGFANRSQTYSNETVNGLMVINKPNVILKNMKINGDLIVAEGVGDGDLTLTGTRVTGNMIVKGGGSDTIHINGQSNINKISLLKTDSTVRLDVSASAKVGTVLAANGSDDIIISGTVDKLDINCTENKVAAVNAQINNVSISSSGVQFAIDNSSKIENLTVTGAGSQINTEGTVTTININSAGIDFIANNSSNTANLNISSTARNSKVEIRGKVVRLNISADGATIKGTTNSDIKNLKTIGSASNSTIETDGAIQEVQIQAENTVFTATDNSKINTITVDSQYSEVYVQGSASNIIFNSPNSQISVEGTVSNIDVNNLASNTQIYAERYSQIGNINSKAQNTQISGTGKILNQQVPNSAVQTQPSTQQTVAKPTEVQAEQSTEDFEPNETSAHKANTKSTNNQVETQQTQQNEKPVSPSISETKLSFSKNSPQDVTLTIDWGSGKLAAAKVVSVTVAGKKLDGTTDYSVSGNYITIKKEVLGDLIEGSKAVIVTFDDIFSKSGKLTLTIE